MPNKACQVNFDEINIETCYRSGCQALQNEKMVEEIKFLREHINEKKLIFVETINREEDILSERVKKDTNRKNMSESCINDEILVCKCVNSPIKSDIALHKK